MSQRRLIVDPTKFVHAVFKASSNDLAFVENHPAKIMLSKPIAVGFAILEITKLVVYEFYYDFLLTTFGKRL